MENKEHNISLHLDRVVTMLLAGSIWHAKSANLCRKLGVRGVARFHDVENMNNGKDLRCFSKIITDEMGYIPIIDTTNLQQYADYNVSSASNFKKHFSDWLTHEKEFESILIELLPHTQHNISVYKKVMELLECVQNEIFSVEKLKNSLEFVGWNPHDISIKSMCLHNYFENDHKEDHPIDFNLG